MTAFNKNDWPFDINFMHQKFGVHEWIEKNKDNKELYFSDKCSLLSIT